MCSTREFTSFQTTTVACRALGFNDFFDGNFTGHVAIEPIVVEAAPFFDFRLNCSDNRNLSECETGFRVQNSVCPPIQFLRIQCLGKLTTLHVASPICTVFGCTILIKLIW